MEKENNQINLRIKDGEQFYSNETAINFGPLEVILDFKCASHIQDALNMRSILLSHNVVILTPYHVKSFSEVLSKAVKDYESKFGEIKKPEELKKAENMIKKEQKKIDKASKKESKDDNAYFG